MSSNSIDLSGKIDPLTSEILCLVHDVAKSLTIDFFVVGATARDLILHHVHGMKLKRATRDIDLGIEVGLWSAYVRLRQALLHAGQFTESPQAQRLLHTSGIPLDIVPFGEIATEEGLIRWPPDSAIVMSVLGFPEAYANSQMVRLRSSPPVEVAVATPVGLAMLKLITWFEASFGLRDKHALDLAFIVSNYLNFGNADRVYDDEGLMENFDYDLTGARLLGRDIAQIASPETLDRMLGILEKETSARGSLPAAMSGRSTSLPADQCLRLLEALEFGLKDWHTR